ncbi:MAG: hypothetical protein ACI9Y7_000259 [Dokdonia sp.]|jgi:hypothetical protein
MTTEETTRLNELKATLQNCPEGCAVEVLGLPTLEEFLALLIKEEENI